MKSPRQFIADTSGSTIVEFAIVGPWFLLLLLAIIELGLTLFTQSVLDGATRDAARLVRTGQAQNAGTTTAAQLQAFQTLLCQDLASVLPQATCDGKVLIYVNSFGAYPATGFGAVNFNNACNKNAGAGGPGVACPFLPGGPRQVVGVQV